MAAAAEPSLKAYCALSPSGQYVQISKELFETLQIFIGEKRSENAGRAEIDFRNGGVAGVRYTVIKK